MFIFHPGFIQGCKDVRQTFAHNFIDRKQFLFLSKTFKDVELDPTPNPTLTLKRIYKSPNPNPDSYHKTNSIMRKP